MQRHLTIRIHSHWCQANITQRLFEFRFDNLAGRDQLFSEPDGSSEHTLFPIDLLGLQLTRRLCAFAFETEEVVDTEQGTELTE